MVLAYLISDATITERMDRIRLRMRLEEISGVSASNKESFLEVCRQYEQEQRHGLLNWRDEQQNDQDGWKRYMNWNSFTDWHDFISSHSL